MNETFQPFKAGNIYKMRHGNVWATMLLSDALMGGVEYSALEQLRNAMELPGVERFTITPDMHTGYGFPIGSVVESSTHLYPDVVGPDPACSVSLMEVTGIDNLSQADENTRRRILGEMGRRISVGAGMKSVPRQARPLTLHEFKWIIMGQLREKNTWVGNSDYMLYEHLHTTEWKDVWELLRNLLTQGHLGQLGSIGGGNHFVEVQEDENGRVFVMAHFGSRGIGAKGAKFFDEAIEAELAKWGAHPKNKLLYVPSDSRLGRFYYAFQQAMLEWTTHNHRIVQHSVAESIREVLPEAQFNFVGHVPHNFIEERNGKFVGRKGATPAYDNNGIPLLIPGSMGTGSYVLRPGEMAPKLGESVSHGAGRVLSRGKAKETLDQDTINREFAARGVLGNFQNVPLDESHGAYKDVDEVIQSLVDAEVAVVERKLKPVLVLKGT